MAGNGLDGAWRCRLLGACTECSQGEDCQFDLQFSVNNKVSASLVAGEGHRLDVAANPHWAAWNKALNLSEGHGGESEKLQNVKSHTAGWASYESRQAAC